MPTAQPVFQRKSQPQRGVVLAALSKPLRDFVQTESASAGLLVVATVVALAWANSPWSSSYFSLLETDVALQFGSQALEMDLLHWINDGLMVVFFFVIGLELRQEISIGELRQRRRLIIPALGGIAGIAVPAALYLVLNPSGEARGGWGVVIGTDTAFLLGALALLGPKAPTQLRVLLLTMTVVDDLLAVAIIGAVYSESIDPGAIVFAIAGLAGIALLGRAAVWQLLAYGLFGGAAWLATIQSGLHPSIVGMLAGLLVVAHPPRRSELERASRMVAAFRQSPVPSAGRSAGRGLQRAVSVNERLQNILHPWTSFAIVPVFALANAGVDLRGGMLGEALTSSVTWGIVIGLVAGKPIGIGLAAIGGARLGLGPLPRGLGPGQIVGGGALAGMGFSVSLLIVNLAFDSAQLRQEATVAVLLACALSALTGWLTFRGASLILGEKTEALPTRLDAPIDVERDHVRGPIDAPLTLVEYGDFECPFCGTATNVVDELRVRFGDELRYVFRHLPLPDVHPRAELAAQAVEAAGTQGRFWEMYDLLFRHQEELELEDLLGYAGALGLDVEAFTRALTEGRHADRVRGDAASAEASGALQTPTFFIGSRRHMGAWDTASLARELELARSSPAS